MKRFLLAFILLSGLAAGCSNYSPTANSPAATGSADSSVSSSMSSPYNKKFLVGNSEVNIQVVTTPQDMEQGLSDRPSMAANEGMLFNFGTSTTPAFWMPRMHFSLDMVWINSGKIIGITPNVPAPKLPSDPLPYYYPPSPITEVLEVNAGWCAMNNIKVGDNIAQEN